MDRFREFAIKIADILEVDAESLSPETKFRDTTPYWSSLMGFGMLVMLEEDYECKISVDDFLKARTLGQLFERIR